jgi:hypothetical protein
VPVVFALPRVSEDDGALNCAMAGAAVVKMAAQINDFSTWYPDQ